MPQLFTQIQFRLPQSRLREAKRSGNANPSLIPPLAMADPPASTLLLLDPPFDDIFSEEIPLPLPADDLRDLDFDLDFNDFSIDDFLASPDTQHRLSSHPSPDPHSTDGSAVSSSSTPRQEDPLETADHPSSPDSGGCSSASGVFSADRELKLEQQKVALCQKRKMETDEERYEDTNPRPDSNSRSSKFRRSDEESSPCVFGHEEDKRTARLMRNRESAQLSRQRKKHYVEELEDKVRAMHSTIAELNNKISYVVAENANLRQQLGGTGVPPSGFPPPGAIAPMHFPWVPGYALRPQGSQIPLVPIPRLKPQQPAPASKANKSDSKKGERKTKKVASVSLIGLLFFLLAVAVTIPGVNLWNGGNEVSEHLSGSQFLRQSNGRILSVRGRHGVPNNADEIVGCIGKKGLGEGGIDTFTDNKRCENCKVNHGLTPNGSNTWPSHGSDAVFSDNSTENLPALLYVPRNGKHVKINGNLILYSVLASEKAMQQTKEQSSGEGEETALAVAGHAMSALAVSTAGKEVDQHTKPYGIASDADHTYPNNPKSTSADGSLQQWFREGMAGSIFSSGMCTEVFQFDVSPASSASGIIPTTNSIINASSIVNASDILPHSSHSEKIVSRRMMHPKPIPLRGTTINNTRQYDNSSDNSDFHGNKPASTVVVSVLADPREAGDGESDGRVSPNSLSRIFVVVLLDSVKYVTYSCVLPFKTSTPHLVN